MHTWSAPTPRYIHKCINNTYRG